MTEGNIASGRANARPDAIELSFILGDLAATAARLGILIRFGAAEQSHFLKHGGAGSDVVLARWAQSNTLAVDALAELERAHARLEAASRHVMAVIGDADGRAGEASTDPA